MGAAAAVVVAGLVAVVAVAAGLIAVVAVAAGFAGAGLAAGAAAGLELLPMLPALASIKGKKATTRAAAIDNTALIQRAAESSSSRLSTTSTDFCPALTVVNWLAAVLAGGELGTPMPTNAGAARAMNTRVATAIDKAGALRMLLQERRMVSDLWL